MLVVVVGVPVLLILLLVFGMKRSFSEGAASYQELSFDEYDRQMAEHGAGGDGSKSASVAGRGGP